MTREGDTRAADESSEIARLWYVRDVPACGRHWLVYSLEFVLANLQGCAADRSKIRLTPAWRMIGFSVLGVMAVLQVLIMLSARIPGISALVETLARVFTRNAFGFFLRACYWKAKLGHLGQDTVIDQNVDVWGAKNVTIGSNCHIDTHVRLAAGEARYGQGGSIKIGNYVHLGAGVHVAGRGGVEIRDFVGISANAHLYSATGVPYSQDDPGLLVSMSHMAPHELQHVYEAPILVEEYAFIGIMARIMPGITVGRGAIVHANSEPRRDVPPFANYGGLPNGKQVGWRKPLRPSPHLKKPPEPESSASGSEPKAEK